MIDIKEVAVRNTYSIMLKRHPTLKPTLDLMLQLRLQQIGIEVDGKNKW